MPTAFVVRERVPSFRKVFLGADELGTLELNDSVGTEYERINPDQVIEGQGSIVFRPALPSGANLNLSQPGWGLSSFPLPSPANQ
jgi:hypothetical protein